MYVCVCVCGNATLIFLFFFPSFRVYPWWVTEVDVEVE